MTVRRGARTIRHDDDYDDELAAGELAGSADDGFADRDAGLTAVQAARAALRQIAELTGRQAEGITGVEPADDGWMVGIEVLEDQRIPSSSDILAAYETALDADGELLSYRLDCLWGLLDGINDAGLALSLTFGGRPQVGEGSGIPLVIRYVLQTCATAEQAMRALRRIPVHMSCNVTALDRDGQRATVYLAPDRPAQVTGLAVAANHQGTVEWPPYAAAIRTVERHDRLTELITAGTDVPGVVAACLRPPLYATRFGACGTSEPTTSISGSAPRNRTRDSP